MGVEKLTAHFNPVLDNVGGGKTAGWVEKLTGEAEFKPGRDESSLVRLREGEEREGRRREVGRELSGAFERRRRVRREKTGKQQSTHGAGTAAV